MKKNAFTLIELLAVIVILGILLAISTVAVNSIRKNQQEENRRNTISGILTGARRYASDNNTLSNLDVNNKTMDISVKDIVDGNYADIDINEYNDIYDNGIVSVAICDNNSNKVMYSYNDKTVDKTYNDCGCKEQSNGSNPSSELCTD